MPTDRNSQLPVSVSPVAFRTSSNWKMSPAVSPSVEREKVCDVYCAVVLVGIESAVSACALDQEFVALLLTRNL